MTVEVGPASDFWIQLPDQFLRLSRRSGFDQPPDLG